MLAKKPARVIAASLRMSVFRLIVLICIVASAFFACSRSPRVTEDVPKKPLAEDSVSLPSLRSPTEQAAQMPETALRTALDEVRDLKDEDVSSEVRRMRYREVIARNFRAAVAWAEGIGATEPGLEMFWAAAVDILAGSNPAVALPLAQRTSGDLRFALVRDVFSEWAADDLEAAKTQALALAEHRDRDAASSAVLREAIQEDFAAAMAWVGSVQDVPIRDILYLEALPEWAAKDPHGAATFTASLEEGDYKTYAAGQLTGTWAAESPAAAVTWAGALGDQESREEALRMALETVAATRPEAAANLALRMPSETDRWNALEGVVLSWADVNPQAAMHWAEGVADPSARERLVWMLDDKRAPR
jgi:hypothetical protein